MIQRHFGRNNRTMAIVATRWSYNRRNSGRRKEVRIASKPRPKESTSSADLSFLPKDPRTADIDGNLKGIEICVDHARVIILVAIRRHRLFALRPFLFSVYNAFCSGNREQRNCPPFDSAIDGERHDKGCIYSYTLHTIENEVIEPIIPLRSYILRYKTTCIPSTFDPHGTPFFLLHNIITNPFSILINPHQPSNQ